MNTGVVLVGGERNCQNENAVGGGGVVWAGWTAAVRHACPQQENVNNKKEQITTKMPLWWVVSGLVKLVSKT